MRVRESEKLMINEFQASLDNVPLQTLYVTQTSSTYTSSGYTFDIKSPSMNALLDPEIWIKYTIRLVDIGQNFIVSCYSNPDGDAVTGQYSLTANTLAFRGGNIMQRATQNLNVTINGHTLTCQPNKFIDVLNRIHITQDQSSHEFSASGGCFNSGNCSGLGYDVYNHLTDLVTFQQAAAVVDDEAAVNVPLALDLKMGYGLKVDNFVPNIRPNVPVSSEFYNPGLAERQFKLARKIREQTANLPNLSPELRYLGTQVSANHYYYEFYIYERLPISPFKIYTKDDVYGVIPNIRQMQITGSFSNNMLPNILVSNNLNAGTNISMYWTDISASSCEMYLKWYTPPMNVSIPAQISIPYRRIHSYEKTISPAAPTVGAVPPELNISEYNITMDAIPDIILIFFTVRKDAERVIDADDSNLEITNIDLTIEGGSGKSNSIKTIQLYQMWLKYLKHGKQQCTTYDNWRKYNCVAVYKPEDYGCIAPPGYDNPVTFGLTCTVKNYHVWPGVSYNSTTPFGASAIDTVAYEMHITQIYEKWALTLTSSGSAKAEMQRYVRGGRDQATAVPTGIGNVSI